jgi:hypothetical protein
MEKTRRKILVLTLAAALLWPGAAMAQATANTQFFSNMSDVPLMQGLTEVPARDSAFDKPEGRIVESSAVAAGGLDAAAISAFYAATLPQLGWAPSGDNAFTRQGEILTLKTARENGVLVARFLIAPQ